MCKALSSIPTTGEKKKARHPWFTSIILAIQEAEIRRISIEASQGK
jgi:hypothetical protein